MMKSQRNYSQNKKRFTNEQISTNRQDHVEPEFGTVKIFVRQSDDEKTATKNLQWALKKFKKMVDNANILKDYQKHEFYEKPSDIHRREKNQLKRSASSNNKNKNDHNNTDVFDT